MKLIMVLLGGLFMAFSSLTLAKESVDESYKFYQVNPNSKTEILSSLNKTSPIKSDGSIFHGYAYSYIKWNFRWKYNKNSCWITYVNTELNTTYTLPKLVSDIEEVNGIWNKWYPNLVIHEKGHHQLAIAIAQKIQKKITELPSLATCSELEQKANGIGYKLVDELGLLNHEYDERTNHGETQGASLFSYL